MLGSNQDRAVAQSLLGVLRTMGEGELVISKTEHGFKADISGAFYTTPECDKHLADLSVAISYARS